MKRTKVVLLEREESYTMGHNDTSFVANLIPLKRDEYYAVAITSWYFEDSGGE